MRDVLNRLQTISEEQEDYEPPEYTGPEFDVDKGSLIQVAMVYDRTSSMEDVLKEAQSIRKEISMLNLEVERLKIHNDRYGTTVRRLTLLKKDSDTIARGIQQRARSVNDHIKLLGEESSRLEEKEGLYAAVSRIARVQYQTLSHEFQAVMDNYSQAEEKQKTTCRSRIKRQASIIGTDITDETLDNLVDKGGEGWTELSQNLHLQESRSCRTALCDIKSRHKDLVELEARLKEIHELFMQMALLVEEQGCLVNSIEVNVNKSLSHLVDFDHNIKSAIKHKKKNPFLNFCPCLRCW